MDFFNKLAEQFIKANRRLKKWQRVVSALAAVVVFVTTYAMVLPAITLDKETASAQAGIEIAASENDPESGGTVYETAPEEESSEEFSDEEPQDAVSAAENSESESGSREAEFSEEQDEGPEEDNSGENTETEDNQSTEAEYLPDDTGDASDAEEEAASTDITDETAAEEEPGEEIRLITEETQLIYEYIDEEYENGIEDENEDGIDDGYFVYAEFGADAKLPEGVELTADEITKESDPEVYEAYYEKALSGLHDKYDENTALSFAKFYDIKFIYYGEEVEPSGDVKVRIEYKKAVEIEKETNVDAVHFDKNNDEEPEVIDSEVEAEKKGKEDTVKTVEFESDRFSVYGVVGSYTVDFHYEVDGKKYTFSILGGSAIDLKDLLPIIGVISDHPDTEMNELDKFEQEITDVVFSNEDLIKVAHPDKDITLKELKEDLGIDNVLYFSYLEEEEADIDITPDDGGGYYIDESAGDTGGLSFSAPEADEEEEPAEDTQEEEYPAAATWIVPTDDSGEQDNEDAKVITLLQDEDTIAAGTWVLISLQPFTSDETLTVSMKNGDVFTVRVTDEQSIAWDVWFDGTLGQGGRSNRFYNGANNIHTSVAKNQMVGSVTITMPAVGEQVYGSGGTTRVSAPNSTGYSYKLNGWYDIKKGIMYQPGDVVRITQDTVFYADWVPENYNKGPKNGAATLNTPSTTGFVKTELFDYNELINTYGTTIRVDVGYPGGSIAHTDNWQSNSDFNFISWNYNGNPSNSIGMPGNLQTASQYRYDTLTKKIYENNTTFIEDIFSTSKEMIGKTYVGTGDHLFNYNPVTGEYYYDSDKNGATYNQEQNRFYVYQDKEYIYDNDETTAMTNFLPFNDQPGNQGNVPNQNTGATDYWFGMKNTIDFYLPDDVALSHGDGNKNPVSDEDMIFKFSGDDDVWVFVEDETGKKYQVLDLGGIHNRAGGFINFSTGQVTTFKGTIEDRENVVVDPDATAALQNLKSGNCKLTVYYLERGSSLSNCSIYFNLEPQPKTLELSKRLEGLTEEERAKYTDEEFTYELLINGVPYNSNPEGVREPDDDRYYAVYYDKDGHEIKEMKGDVEVVKKRRIIDGQITIKDGETVRIPRLNRLDTVFVAEEKGLNMNQFEIPHAERIYTDISSVRHEEDVELHRDHSAIADVDDWITPSFKVQDTDKVTFTNTLRETELEVKKRWVEEEPKTTHPPIQFTVEATIEGAGGTPERYKVDQLRDPSDTNKNKVFTLNTPDNASEAVYRITKLPVMTPGLEQGLQQAEGKPITYTVSEVTVADYSTTYETSETLQDIEVMKLWADGSHDQETVRVKLQRLSDSKYYTGSVNGVATFGDENEAQFTELTPDPIGNYTCRFTDVPRDDTYKIVQDADQNQNTTGLVMYRRDVVGHVITNTEDNRKITVIKKWLQPDGVHEMETAPQDHINYTVYQSYHIHSWGEWQKGTKDDPDDSRYETRYCIYDHSHYQTRDAVHTHTWTAVVQEPTCTVPGKTVYTCSCGASYEEEIPPRGHKHVEAGTTAATCEQDGSIIYTCRNTWHDASGNEVTCGDTYTTLIPALKHEWGPWTDNNDGTESRICIRGDKKQTRAISPYDTPVPFNSDLKYADAAEVLPAPPTPFDQNQQANFSKTGVFLLDGHYYIITKDANRNWGNVWKNGNYDLTELKSDGNTVIEISANSVVYDDYSFTQGSTFNSNNGERDPVSRGSLYHGQDGSWYVYIGNASNAKAPQYYEEGNDRWLKLDTGESTITETYLTPPSPSLAPARPGLLGAPKPTTGGNGGMENQPDDSESMGKGSGSGGLRNTKNGSSVQALPTALSSLESIFDQVDENGRRHDGQGNYLIVYGNYELKQSEHADWMMQIKVSNPEDEWTNYRYYVAETDPSTGYITTYVYEDKNGSGYTEVSSTDGIKEEGRVTIKNQQKPLTTDIDILKKDEKGSPLPGAVFRLLKLEGEEYQAIKSICETGTQTPKYPEVGGLDANSRFTSTGTAVTITKLPDGSYKLVEDESPDGYVIINGTIEFEIEEGAVKGTDSADGKIKFNQNGIEITIVNTPGTELPHTGGPGTKAFTICGLMLTVGAGLLMWRRRRRI